MRRLLAFYRWLRPRYPEPDTTSLMGRYWRVEHGCTCRHCGEWHACDPQEVDG